MAALVQRADDPAVVGRRAVPVGRDEARAEEGDLHLLRRLPPLRSARLGSLVNDVQQLVDPVRAGVPLVHRAAAAGAESRRVARLLEHRLKQLRHLLAVARHQVVAAGREEALAVLPGRADQRDAAGQRLEGADRRDARQRLGIRPARNVHRDAEAREGARHLVVRQPAGVLDARRRAARGAPTPGSARRRRAPAARAARTGSSRNSCSSAVRSSSPQLPIQTRSPSRATPGERLEDARVGRLVPGPGRCAQPRREVEVAQHGAEGEHAVVVATGRTGRSVSGRGDRAVVRVVEQQHEAAAAARAAGRSRAPARARSTRGPAPRRRPRAPRRGRAQSSS